MFEKECMKECYEDEVVVATFRMNVQKRVHERVKRDKVKRVTKLQGGDISNECSKTCA